MQLKLTTPPRLKPIRVTALLAAKDDFVRNMASKVPATLAWSTAKTNYLLAVFMKLRRFEKIEPVLLLLFPC